MVFLVRNHLFLEKKMVFGGLLLVKKMVLPGEDLQKPSFSRQKDGSEPKNHLFLEKTKKPSFGGTSPIVLEKMFFFFFFFFFFL